MKGKRKALFVIIIACLLAVPAFAAFDTDGWGARPVGMGGAFTAVCDDANSIFHNAAGTARLKHMEGIFMHGIPFAGLDLKVWDDDTLEFRDVNLGLNYLALTYPLGAYGTVGLGWINFNATDLYSENAISLNYALQVVDSEKRRRRTGNAIDLYSGLNLKLISHAYSLDDNDRAAGDAVFGGDGTLTSKAGITADLGLLGVINKEISLGLSIKNAIPANVGIYEKEYLLPQVGIGAAYRYKDIKPAIDIVYKFGVPKIQRFNVGIGCEAWFLSKMIGVRAGLNLDWIGAGFSFSKNSEMLGMQVDYSFNYPYLVRAQYGTHRLALTVKFDREGVLDMERVAELGELGRKDKKANTKQYYDQGVQYYKQGEYKKAIRAWQKALLLNPSNNKVKALIEKAEKKLE